MSSFWGFKSSVILEGLKVLGIETKPREYNNAPYGLAREAFERQGGIEKVLKSFGSMLKFSKVCKVTSSNLGAYLRKCGYFYDRHEGRWKKVTNE